MKPYRLLEIIDRIIHAPQTLKRARYSEKHFTRDRKMPFTDVLHFFFDMNKTSLQTRLNQFFRGNTDTMMSEQAFSKARNHFDHSPFETMHRELVGEEYARNEDLLQTWNGYFVFAVDGTYYLLPKRKALHDAFGTRGEGGRCVSAGSSVLYDVLNNWPVDPILTHSAMNERNECMNHLNSLCRHLPHIAERSLILLDRGYPAIDLFKKFNAKGMKYLARCSKNYCKVTETAPMGDSTAELDKGLPVRIYKFVLDNGDTETLITNLFDVPCEEFPALYAMRWGIEGFYFKLKNIVSIEKFSGRTENAIRQDFWVSMVLMIAVAVFQRDADKMIEIRQKHKNNKHIYKAKTSDLVVNLRNHFIFSVFRQDPDCMDILQNIIELCAYSVSAVQPHRHSPRTFSQHSNPHDNLKSRL